MQSDKIVTMLDKLQKEKKYSNYEICKRAGINRSVYETVLCSGNPKIETLQAIIGVYGYSIQDFFDLLEGKDHVLSYREKIERTSRELEAIQVRISYVQSDLERMN